MVRITAKDWRLQVLATTFAMLILAALAVSSAQASARSANAEVFIEDLASSGIAMLTEGSYTDAERELEFRRLVRRGFALDAVGRYVAGRHWRTMSEGQRAEFQELFSEWMLTSYARRLGGYNGQTIEIIKSTKMNNRTGDIVVKTRLVDTGGQLPISAAWRIRQMDGNFKIIDVIVEGVSMATAQRAEFDAVMRRVGVEGLLDNLRSRLGVLVAGAG